MEILQVGLLGTLKKHFLQLLCQYCNGFHLAFTWIKVWDTKKFLFQIELSITKSIDQKFLFFINSRRIYTTTCIFNVGVENYVRQEQRLCGVIGGKTPLSLLFREITTVTNPSSSPPKTTEYTNHCILSFGISRRRTNLQILSFELS